MINILYIQIIPTLLANNYADILEAIPLPNQGLDQSIRIAASLTTFAQRAVRCPELPCPAEE